MFLSDLSIKRPVFAAVLMLALVTLGAFSYRRLTIDLNPDVEIPLLTIITKYPGASPETVEREVTKRIEEAVNPIPGVKRLMSNSREGMSVLTVEFQLEVKIDMASEEARAKIAAIRGDLPRGAEDSIIQKLDLNGTPVLSLAVRSKTLSPRAISELADRKIKRRIESISGVGKVDLVGENEREVRINLNTDLLDSFGMGIDEVIAGLQSENVNTPLGRLTSGKSEASLRVMGKPEAAAHFKTMVIGQRGGRPIKLSDVAEVVDGTEERRKLALVGGETAVGLDILKQTGSNTVVVVERVKKQLGRLKEELPPGTTVDIVRDGSQMIYDSFEDLKTSLLLGGALTIFIVFCFLNSWRSTVITGLTLPISVMSSFTIMNACGMTLNIMTMMALSLVIGLLIDDAIVVRENIVRHMEMGKDHLTAARDGTSEIGLAVLATTFSIVAVFVPVAFMKGIVGRFFFQFGIVVAFTVMVSLFVSFTLDPMLSSRWYDPSIERGPGIKRGFITRLLDHFNAFFDWLAGYYERLIGWVLDHRKTALLLAVLAFVGGMMVMGKLKSEFMVTYDRSEFVIAFKTAPGSSFAETDNRLKAILARLSGIKEIDHTYASIGAGDTGTVRDGSIYVKLVDRDQRKRHQEAVRAEARTLLADVPGVILSVETADNPMGQKPVQVKIRGENIGLLKQYAARLKRQMKMIPGLKDLEATMEFDEPEYRLVVDRQKASDVGIMTRDISRMLETLVGGNAVSTYEDEEGEAVDVRLRLPESQRLDIAQIQRLRIVGRDAKGLPKLLNLGDLVSVERSSTPSEISRESMIRQVVVSANLDNLPLGEAMRQGNEIIAKMKFAPGYSAAFAGQADDMIETFTYMIEALMLAVIFVYLILAAQFESFLDPLAIMLSLPLSILGMAGMLYLTHDTINIMSMIGLIMLMGLVTKNAILLIDFAKVLRRKGYGRRAALITAGRTRLRPIMMTTLAMILGMMPLALALGAGAEMRAPMARAVVGGLITSTMLTLLVVPVVYTLLDDAAAFLLRRPTIAPPPDDEDGEAEGGALNTEPENAPA